MDADNRIIPVVEDDQGEGIKDPLTIDDLIRMRNIEYGTPAFEKMMNQFTKRQENQPEVRWDETKTVVPPKITQRRGS